MANEIVTTLTNNLNLSLEAVKDALPKDFNSSRFLQNAIAVVKAKPDLMKYNQTELLQCMLKGAYLGLDFMNQEAWLVPYGGHVTFQSGYKGDCKFVKKYSIRPLQDIFAKVVRRGDELEYGVENGKPYLNYKPIPFNGDEIVGVFAVAYFSDGGCLYEVMTMDEVNKVRKVSKCSGTGPWKDWFDQMAMKTVLRRLAKSIETDFDNVNQKEAWDEGSGVDFNNRTEPGDVVDAFDEKVVADVECEVVDSE